MKIINTPLDGLLVFAPEIYEDDRGYFFESWNKKIFKKLGLNYEFNQDNQSLSKYGVLRGLHFQNPPYAQGKLVRVVKGKVLDVVVDIRSDSSTYGSHYKIELSETNKLIFWIPPGFAHGFITLENDTIFSYKCTSIYNKKSEQALLWSDKTLNIDWQIKKPIVSQKDQNAIKFLSFKSKF
ncbi:MAG: dTDP-4-dehydrorhamnose 3,5-epimerase [Flavobacteriales bacterium]|nr:dTDP-4-dehydrorhamnose 3,5-epimerase [Flavobacteriales bacterium]